MLTSTAYRWRRYRPVNPSRGTNGLSVKVLHSFYRSTQPSGENDAVHQQISLMSDHGFDVELIFLSSDDLEANHLAKPLTALGLAMGVPRAKPPDSWLDDADILHIHNTFPAMSHEWLSSVNLPKVLTAHNYRAFCANGLFLRDGSRCMDCVTNTNLQAVRHACYRQSRLQTIPLVLQQRSPRSLVHLMNNCDRVLLPGEPMQDTFRGLGIRNTQVLHNPVPRTDSEPGSRPLTNEWLFVGRISPEKGLVDLLDIWPRSEALAVVGDGPQRQAAEKVASERQLTARFLGQCESQEVNQLMSQSLGLVFPSKALEGAPLVYGESMQAGLSLVAAEGSTLATQTRTDETGMTFSWSEPGSLDNALTATRMSRTALSSRARQVYLDRYTPETWIDQVTKIYEIAIANHKRSTHPSA